MQSKIGLHVVHGFVLYMGAHYACMGINMVSSIDDCFSEMTVSQHNRQPRRTLNLTQRGSMVLMGML